MAYTTDNENPNSPVRVMYPYIQKLPPLRFQTTTAYAANETKLEVTENHEWFHPIGAVATSLIEAGLRFEFLHEHPEITTRATPYFAPREPGQCRIPHYWLNIRLSFSLKVVKPQT